MIYAKHRQTVFIQRIQISPNPIPSFLCTSPSLYIHNGLIFYILRFKEETYHVRRQDFMIIRGTFFCLNNLYDDADNLIKCKVIQDNH